MSPGSSVEVECPRCGVWVTVFAKSLCEASEARRVYYAVRDINYSEGVAIIP